MQDVAWLTHRQTAFDWLYSTLKNNEIRPKMFCCFCFCNWGTCTALPTRRPRAHHRVNPYLGARRQWNRNVFRSRQNESVDRSSFSSIGSLFHARSRTTRYGQRCLAVNGLPSNTLEFTPIVRSWSITDTDSVLCASEDCIILQSIRNTSIAPTWQFRLKELLRDHKFTYLLTYS